MTQLEKNDSGQRSIFSLGLKRWLSRTLYCFSNAEQTTEATEAAKVLEKAQKTIAGRYYVLEKIGSGSWGQVFAAVDMTNNGALAAKIAKDEEEYSKLSKEYQIYSVLCNNSGREEGLTCPHYFGSKNNRFVLIMERHGPSLQMILRAGGSMSTKAVLTIAIQSLQRIKYIHSKGFIHRDIKPENMVIGLHKTDTLYIIDFGLANKYINVEQNVHIPYRERVAFIGTVDFSSRNADKGIEQSRRDDLESIGLVVVYLHKGALPWSDISGEDMNEVISRIQEAKEKTSLERLCEGMPPQVLEYISHVRRLQFEEKPDYDALINLFLVALNDIGH